jgi:iron complex outermembrane recepter protein
MSRVVRLGMFVPLVFLATPSHALAQGDPQGLSQVPIEDLMNIEITSASRKQEHAADVAAAVYVITHDDIRRSGMTTIPDLFRLAPGIDVAQINSNQWAVSTRGFNGLYAAKLLVLVDGRSLYNRFFSGVLWTTEDLMLDDIDRIEVIRGPGAAAWGANAVNGVINVITKSAGDTQGALVRVDAGGEGTQIAARYGGALGITRYRLFAQWTRRDQSLIIPGTGANDASQTVTTGFRADRTSRRDAFTLEGAISANQARSLWTALDPETAAREPISKSLSGGIEAHVLSRWTRTRDSGASLQLQSFVELAGRHEPLAEYHRTVVDVSALHHTVLAGRHDLVAGAGYRLSDEYVEGSIGFSLTPADNVVSLLTGFVQDDIALFGSRLTVSFGSQVQYDSNSGAGAQPTARVMWMGLPHQRVWAATSRALRTPSLSDQGIRLDLPPISSAGGLPVFVTVLGNPAAKTETLVDAEAGYRLAFAPTAAIDVTGFVGRYADLQTQEYEAPVVTFVPSPRVLVTSKLDNELEATTRGFEVSGYWSPVQAWRLDGSFTAFHVTPHLGAASQDPSAGTTDASAPRTQWQVQSAWSPGTRATLNVSIFHVGSIERLNIGAYTRADVTAEWRFNSRLSVMAIGQNLFDAAHAEFGGLELLHLATQVPRSASLRLRWTF